MKIYEGNNAVTEGEWTPIAVGVNRLVADIPAGDGASVTYEEKIGEDGQPHTIAINGTAVTHVAGGPTTDFIATGATYIRAKRAGGVATFAVKAIPVAIH